MRVTGIYKEYAAISPFLLEEIRDGLHAIRQNRLREYETRIDSAILKLVRESFPNCKMDLLLHEGEQALWRIDDSTSPRLYIYLAPWTSEQDLNLVKSKMDVPNAANAIVIVLNQSQESAKELIKKVLGVCPELSLISSLSQKEALSQTLIGSTSSFTHKFVESLTAALNLSTPIPRVATQALDTESDITVSDQFGEKQESARILLGSRENREIRWTPTKERNWNVALFGDTQTGKTQVTKRMLLELRRCGIPFVVIDASGEYLPKDPTNSEFGAVVQPGEISINPMELEGGNSPREQRYELISSLDAVCGLKDWEFTYLGRAIERAYEKFGIFEDDPTTWSKTPPTFEDVRANLELIAEHGKGYEKDSIKQIFQKMGAVLEHPLFSQAKTSLLFEKLVSGPFIINLSGMQSPLLKVVTAEFLLARVPRLVESNPVEPKAFVVLDGIQRMMGNDAASLRLLREARQKGLGVILTSQSPVNLPDLAFNNFATILSFRTMDSKNAKTLADHLGMKDAGPLNKWLADKFSGVARFSSEPNITRFSALPYFKGSEQIV